MKIAILILAAGNSSRMGSPKQLLKINGKTFIEIAIENAIETNVKAVFCVLGANAEKITSKISHQNVEFIFNKKYQKGLSSSIVSGVEYIEKQPLNFDAILIVLVDQPEVNSQYLTEIITTYQKNNTKIVASSYSKKSGVPAIFPKKYFKSLQLLKGDKGAKDFLQKHESEIIQLKREQSFLDIDLPEEYQSYLKSLK
ncbi:MAG: nucleotidyltransferase family protein [Polaribacter sp.]